MSSADRPAVEAVRRSLAPHGATLHAIAGDAIREGVGCRSPGEVSLADYPKTLRAEMASFITLRQGEELRGCVGTAYAIRPLAADVARNAYLAAFNDSRFEPLARSEFAATSIEVSVLTPPEPVAFANEDDLLRKIVPGRDGLILEQESRRGLFLPQVWDMVPDAPVFLHLLKDKAGISRRPLDRSVRVHRFEAVKFRAEDSVASV